MGLGHVDTRLDAAINLQNYKPLSRQNAVALAISGYATEVRQSLFFRSFESVRRINIAVEQIIQTPYSYKALKKDSR